MAGGLVGCGYPGETAPPALRRPVQIVDLAALERGSRIYVSFAVPTKTTEGLPLKDAPGLELRVGPLPAGSWNTDAWLGTAARVPSDSIKIEHHRASADFPAGPFVGRPVVIAVRATGPKGASLGWSNFENLPVVAPLPTPQGVAIKDVQDAVRLDWHAAAPEYRVFRRESGMVEWQLAGSTPKPFFVDTEIAYGKEYEYFVQSVEKSGDRYAESDLSETVKFKPVDRFPPATPAGLTAVVGTRSVELLWERSPEKDFSSYRVFRDGKMVFEGGSGPSFSDHDVVAGRKYFYQVTAVDAAGNESPRSAPVEALIP